MHTICFVCVDLNATSTHLLHSQWKASHPFLMCMTVCVLGFSSDICNSLINKDIYTFQKTKILHLSALKNQFRTRKLLSPQQENAFTFHRI